MIVCQCNLITVRDIEQAIERLLADDPWMLIVPVQVYHALGKRGRCCGCFPGVIDIIVRVTSSIHQRLETPEADVISFICQLREEHLRQEGERAAILVRCATARVAA
jgi:hypothetical protein